VTSDVPGPGSGVPLVELQHVTKSYGTGSAQVTVVEDVSLSLHAGECVWLRGASGSGKSSLLRIAGLLSTADSGEVVIEGRPVRGAQGHHELRRRRIGMVFQQGNLLPDLTVADNILVAARGATRAAVAEQLSEWGLADVADRLGKQVSAGQSQRAAFCRALINDPVILLADEPTSGLDQANAERVLRVLDASRAHGRGILVASHDPVMADVADRTLEISDGRLCLT